MELKEYIKSLPEDERFMFQSTFNEKNYERANFKFQKCYKIAEKLQKITTPKAYRAVIEFQTLPTSYVDAILDIATHLAPQYERHYKKIKDCLVETYILRLNKLVKADNVDLLLCTKEKHLKLYNELKVRVIDYSEILDIIYGLGFDFDEFKKGYNGKDKKKQAIDKVYQFLYKGRSKKLEKIKEKTFDNITEQIYKNLEELDIRVGL